MALQRLSWFLSTVFVLFLGIMIRGAPLDPDSAIQPFQMIGVLFIFAFFYMGLISWGRILQRLLFSDHARWIHDLGLGTLFFIILSFGLSELGWIDYSLLPGVIFFLSVGALLSSKEFSLQAFFKMVRTQGLKQNQVTLLALAVVLMIHLYWALRAHGTTDPSLYHLLGPRLWLDQGQANLVFDHPVTHNAWYWEYLFIFGFILTGGPGGLGLIEGQVFAQLLHTTIGFFGVFFGLMSFLRKAPLNQRLLMAIGAVSSNALLSIKALGKNDWGVFFLFLYGVMTLLEARENRSRIKGSIFDVIGGLSLGIALGSKLNALFWVAPFLIAWWILNKPSTRAVLLSFGSMMIGFTPLAIRNTLDTGNPVLPFFPNIFGLDPYGPTRQAFNLEYHPAWGFHWSFFLERIQLLLMDHPLWMLIPVIVVAFYFVQKKERAIALGWLAAITLSMVWFLITPMKLFLLRWGGVSLIAFGGLLTLSLLIVIKHQLKHWKLHSQKTLDRIILLFTFFLLFFQLPHPVRKNPKVLFSFPSPTYVIRTPEIHIGGESKAWLRMNMKPGEKTLTTGDHLLYYVSHLPVIAATESPEIDQELRKIRHDIPFLEAVYQLGFTYLLNTQAWNRPHWSHLSPLSIEIANRSPESVLFKSKDSFILHVPSAYEKLVAKKQ